MGAQHETIPACAGDLAEGRGFPRDEGGEPVGEPFEIGGRGDVQLGVDGERQQPRALLLGPRLHASHIADHGGGAGDQVIRREAILYVFR